MKNTLILILIIAFNLGCNQPEALLTPDDFFVRCGPNDFPSLLIKSVFCSDSVKANILYQQFNDSLQKRNFSIVFQQVSCENVSNQSAGIVLIESGDFLVEITVPSYTILINFEDNNAEHIKLENLKDSLLLAFEKIDIKLDKLYRDISKNPLADSLYRTEFTIDILFKTDANKDLCKTDYEKLTQTLKLISSISAQRADQLSNRIWHKSFNSLNLQQKTVICQSLGFLISVFFRTDPQLSEVFQNKA